MTHSFDTISGLTARIARIEAKEAEQAALVAKGYIHAGPNGVHYGRPLTDSLNWTRTALRTERERLAKMIAAYAPGDSHDDEHAERRAMGLTARD